MSTALLSNEDFQALRATGIPIVVPEQLPLGSVRDDVQTDIDEDFGASYLIRFLGPGGQQLEVYAASAGLGDVFRGEERRSFFNPLLGEGTIEFYADDVEGVDWRAHWISLTGGEGPQVGMAGVGFDAAEAVRLAESLRVLSA